MNLILTIVGLAAFAYLVYAIARDDTASRAAPPSKGSESRVQK